MEKKLTKEEIEAIRKDRDKVVKSGKIITK